MPGKSFSWGTALLWLVLGGAILVAMLPAPDAQTKPTPMPQSELFAVMTAQPAQVAKLQFEGSTVRSTMIDGSVKLTSVPDEVTREELRKLALAHHLQFDSNAPAADGGGSLLGSLLPMLLLGVVGFFVLRFIMGSGAGGGGLPGSNFIKHKGKRVNPADLAKANATKFKDVTGQVEAKQELAEVVQFLKHPEDFKDVKATVPTGVLLVGPPGTGKTLLARAVAGEAGVPFFHVAGSEFIQMFVGVGASRVRDIFKEAREAAPSIMLIDELDAVGRMRGTGMGGGSDEREQTLNQILVEMDGFSKDPDAPPVVVLAATNRPDVLDAALLRPGRFSRQVVVDLPDFDGRKATLELYLKDKPLAPGVNYDFFASATSGMSQADIANIANEAAILSARRRAELRQKGAVDVKLEITAEDLDRAIAKQQFGPERRSLVLSLETRHNTAVHESGHAIAHYAMTNGEIPRKITIMPTTRALGYVQLLAKANQSTQTKEECLAFIVMALAGRAAQMHVLKACDSGASNDFKQAWNVSRKMVAEWGMSDLGVLCAPLGEEHPFLGKTLTESPAVSQALLQEIEAETRKIIGQCQKQTDAIIVKHEQAIRQMSEILLARETILGPELKELLDKLTSEEQPVVIQNVLE